LSTRPQNRALFGSNHLLFMRAIGLCAQPTRPATRSTPMTFSSYRNQSLPCSDVHKVRSCGIATSTSCLPCPASLYTTKQLQTQTNPVQSSVPTLFHHFPSLGTIVEVRPFTEYWIRTRG
jgi:hypothetical protein